MGLAQKPRDAVDLDRVSLKNGFIHGLDL
jgi:hypothetical protein